MRHRAHPPLTGGALDRDGARRADQAALDTAWADPHARLLWLRGRDLPLARRDATAAALHFTATLGERTATHIYLGRDAHGPLFVRALDDAAGDVANEDQPIPAAGWANALEIGALLDDDEAAVMAAALAITAWHADAGFSARDGAPTVPALGGWARHDPHGGEHFPRTDPVVIVRIEHGDRVLLGSNALWESGRFSLLAGFIDAGESAEAAVVREVAEEAGILVDRVQYLTSQPWPFPRSLMLGFRAQLAPGVDPASVVPEPGELSELRWFTREELRTPPPGIRLPGDMSIARWLIDEWIAEGSDD